MGINDLPDMSDVWDAVGFKMNEVDAMDTMDTGNCVPLVRNATLLQRLHVFFALSLFIL